MLTKMPTSIEFRAATNLAITFGPGRESDQILRRVDTLLDQYHTEARSQGTEKTQLALLGKLYFVLERWLKLADARSPQVNARRRSGVYDLWLFVVNRLSSETHVSVNLLPGWLTATFGRSMVEHGVEVDLKNKSAEYISPEKLAKFRLVFQGGLAYQQDWRHDSPALILANSNDIRALENRTNPIHKGFSGYVADLSGNFYSSPHMEGSANQGNGFFHSSYLGGVEVLCAGEIRIEQGFVRQINNDSGHYKPPLRNMVMAVEMLVLSGVNIAEMVVSGHGIKTSTGAEFLDDNRRMEVEELPEGIPGDTALSRHQQHAILVQHAEAEKMSKIFKLFQSHCKKGGVHSWVRKDKCAECKQYSEYFHLFIESLTRQNKERKNTDPEIGIDNMKIGVPVKSSDLKVYYG